MQHKHLKFVIVAQDAKGNMLFQPAGRAVEYGVDRFDVLQQVINGPMRAEDKARLHQIEVFGPFDQNDNLIPQ